MKHSIATDLMGKTNPEWDLVNLGPKPRIKRLRRQWLRQAKAIQRRIRFQKIWNEEIFPKAVQIQPNPLWEFMMSNSRSLLVPQPKPITISESLRKAREDQAKDFMFAPSGVALSWEAFRTQPYFETEPLK